MPAQATAPDRLRDRGIARRQAFLKAARTVFLENGYEAASVNDVVRLAGGSLATLYSQFGSKEGLFLAVAQDQHEIFARETVLENVEHLPFEQYLQAFGERLVQTALKREHLAFYRISIGEGRKFPELLQRYLASGAEQLRINLAGRISTWASEHNIEIENPELIAAFFIDLVRTRLHYRALADYTYVPSETEIRDHVARAVRFFLRGLCG